MSEERQKRMTPKSKPYKKARFDDKIYLKRNSNNLMEDIEDSYIKYEDEVTAK